MRIAVTAAVVAAALTPLTTTSAPASAASSACPWMNAHQSPARRTAELMANMTLDDKIQEVTGSSYSDQTNHGAAGIISANSRLCIPALVLNDAGAGMGDQQQLVTAFPDSIAQTASWDRRLTTRYGRALGTEAFTKGVNTVLAPGVDIDRTPLNGRNFEYAGEDPYLAGQTAVGVIRGIQSKHVIATVKHYAANDQETNRMTASSDVSQRDDGGDRPARLPRGSAAGSCRLGDVLLQPVPRRVRVPEPDLAAPATSRSSSSSTAGS